jgi:signal transduction histidine kinase
MALVRLLTDDDGELPLLDALATLEPFAGQPAALRAAPDAVIFLQGAPIRDQQGGFAGFSGSFRWQNRPGVAQPKSSEPPRPQAALMPPRIDRALRMPLDRIIRSADAIAARDDGPLRHDYAAYASDIAAASRHLLGLVDDLGDVQAIEAKSFQIETEVIDLSDIIRRAAGLLRVRAADRNVRIDTSDAEYPASAKGDYRRVMQILVNLIGNAVRYAPEASSIWVRIEDEDDLVAVIVADQGQGIAAADHARIFDKFERVNPDEPGGTGLGLFISRALARAMGGDITVDSAPGQGARFVLTLPRTVTV